MSKARYNVPRAAIHVGAPAKSFSAAEGYEPERRGWDEKTYHLKNQDTNNHYTISHASISILRLTAKAKSFPFVQIPCHFTNACRSVLTNSVSNPTWTRTIL